MSKKNKKRTKKAIKKNYGKQYPNRYVLQMELNIDRHLIFGVIEENPFRAIHLGFIYFEDYERAGTPNDFQEFHPIFLEDWDDLRNLIVARIIAFQPLNTVQKENLEYLASSMIEFKPSVNHKIEHYVDKELKEQRFSKISQEVNTQSTLKWFESLIQKYSHQNELINPIDPESFNCLAQEFL